MNTKHHNQPTQSTVAIPMNRKNFIKVLCFLIICCILLLVISIKNYGRSYNQSIKSFKVDEIIKVRQKFNKRSLNGTNNCKAKCGNNALGKDVAGKNEDNSTFTTACYPSYHMEITEEVLWYRQNFKQLSPYSLSKNNVKFRNYLNLNQRKQKKTTKTKKEVENENKTKINANEIHPKIFPHLSKDQIVIMTPISNAKEKLKNYFTMLCSLTYPHHLISILLGEDSSYDGTWYEANEHVKKLSGCFRKVEVVQLLGKQKMSGSDERHTKSYQLGRRTHLSMARNQLLLKGVQDNKWVLWIDVDVKHAPADLIEHMLSCEKDIVAVNSLYRSGQNTTDVYDRNTWTETETSMRTLAQKNADYLMLEGYRQTERKYLEHLKFDEKTKKANLVVKLDGVGGCVLLVNADLHRKGLNFPAFIFDHHIETEGFAKMASRVYHTQPYGLPHVVTIHW